MALPKINLRDLFWLVVVVAMGLGWWLDHRAILRESATSKAEASLWEARARALVSLLGEHGWQVSFEDVFISGYKDESTEDDQGWKQRGWLMRITPPK